ncbi:site-specific DNA-methyltransferase [Apilactobacillus apinorum]|uniref:site-specific DNA-methyltransferase n=1 Tax=Apilactobacillus apinorum TaxID=1218495 RepID=UPI0030E7E73D
MKIEPKIMYQVKSILGEFGNKYLTSGGFLRRNNVINDLDKFDRELMTKLFKDPLIHKNYVEKIADTELFKLNQFIEMFEYKEFWEDSYTKYTNKIGLTANGKFIDESADVVLDFPFKDTVLKAGMTKEDLDKDASVDEPFLNETIAKPEIDELLEPKIFVNARRYDQNGERKAVKYSNQDNLIIKGNNLIALHSIAKKYAGKVKIIYLDPPYNTGSDSFQYNDHFDHATWLTFMKSRLEIAYNLLSEDGSIFIEIDSFEDSYLKVLMDEIFGRDNFRNKINWKRRGGSANPAKQLNNVVEYILWYSKDVNQMKYHPVYTKNNTNTQKYIKERFTNIDSQGRRFMKSPIQSPNYRPNLIYDYKGYKTPKKGYSVSKKVLEKWDKEGRLAFPDSKSKNINRKIFLDEYKGQPINSLWDDIFVINPMSKERLNVFSSGQKPEALIQRIISMVTDPGDIVLDFFIGSGTTASAALKMHRRFIGVEQMDYINTISVPRLQKVIAGEQGGISKDVNWQGGGSFVYAELMEKNQGYLKGLQKATTLDELDAVFQRMKVGADFDFRVDLDKYENDAERKTLPFEEQKQLLVKLLDKNQLYYNFNNIDDADVRDLISDKDYQFNQSFYGKRD